LNYPFFKAQFTAESYIIYLFPVTGYSITEFKPTGYRQTVNNPVIEAKSKINNQQSTISNHLIR